MVVVAGIWEQGWNTPIKEYDLWHYVLMDFGVDEYAMSPVSGIKGKIKEFHNVEEIIKYYNLPVILCDESYGSIDLKDFEHPKDALYLFGRTNMGLPVMNRESYTSIKFSTPKNLGTIWAHQAAGIILYDRFLKNGNNDSR